MIQAREAFSVQRVLAIIYDVAPPTMRRSSRCRCEYLFPKTKSNSLGNKAAALKMSRLKLATPPAIPA